MCIPAFLSRLCHLKCPQALLAAPGVRKTGFPLTLRHFHRIFDPTGLRGLQVRVRISRAMRCPSTSDLPYRIPRVVEVELGVRWMAIQN